MNNGSLSPFCCYYYYQMTFLNLKLMYIYWGLSKDWKIRGFNRRTYFFAGPLMAFLILHLFYLSSHIALTGNLFTIFCHWQRNSFLVPVSCWATITNINSAYKLISPDFTEDKIKNVKNDACLISFLTIWQLFWGFWYYTIDRIYVYCWKINDLFPVAVEQVR